MSYLVIIDAHGCSLSDVFILPTNVTVRYASSPGSCPFTDNGLRNYSMLVHTGLRDSPYARRVLFRNPGFAHNLLPIGVAQLDVAAPNTTVLNMSFGRDGEDRANPTYYTATGGFLNAVQVIGPTSFQEFPLENGMQLHQIVEQVLRLIVESGGSPDTQLNVYVNACRSACPTLEELANSDDSDDDFDYEKFAQELEESVMEAD